MKALYTVLLIGLVGCASKLPAVDTKEKEVIQQRFRTANSTTLEVPLIIDVHTHTFNSQYLPVDGIARQRVPRLGDVLAKAVIGVGCIQPSTDTVCGASTTVQNEPNRLEASEGSYEDLNDFKKSLLKSSIQATSEMESPAARSGSPKMSRGSVDERNRYKEIVQEWILDQFVIKVFGKQYSLISSGGTNLVGAWAFIDTVRRPESEVVCRLTNSAFASVDLFVHHMMDMGPSFNQMPDTNKDCGRFLDFESEQIPRALETDREAGGRLIHFVAWNPFRSKEDFMTETPTALRIIQNAVAKGAWGVKFYPPMGYAATGTWFPKKTIWMSKYQKDSIDRCYSGWNPSDLDELNLRLFRWCASNNIPIFAHCNTHEFRARNDSEEYANPIYWRRLLEKHPELINLRLCLGHAGGEEFWIARTRRTAEEERSFQWGSDVYNLCVTYPNVYCEVGIHESLAADETGAVAANLGFNMLELIKRSRTFPYQFDRKIMYGSDWYMPVNVTWREYIDSFKRLVISMDDAEFASSFFGGNAIQWLDLQTRIGNQHGLPEKSKEYLERLVSKRFVRRGSPKPGVTVD